MKGASFIAQGQRSPAPRAVTIGGQMPAPQSVVQAVQAAIVASAHLAAYEHVAAAAQACQRLGSLTSGRWRSAGRDLASLEEDLQEAFATAEGVVDVREAVTV